MKKQIIFIAILSFLMNFANAQWQQINGTYGKIYCIANNGSYLFVGTDSGRVFVSNGSSWTLTNTGSVDNISSFAVNGNNIFASCGGDGGVFLSSNNGNTWTATNISGFDITSLAIISGKIFAGSIAGVFKSLNNGGTWTAVNTGLTTSNIRTLAVNGNDIFAGTGGSGVFFSSNDGSNWTTVNTGLTNLYIYALTISGSNIFAGTQGGVFYSSNNGINWIALANTGLVNSNVRSLAINGSIIYAGLWNGVFLLPSIVGNSWASENTGLADTIIMTLTLNGNDLLAGTYSTGIWKRPLSELTGIKETNNQGSILAVYPVPASDRITIESSGLNTTQKKLISIYNIQGQKILEQPVQQEKTEIDIKSLSKGIYILKIINKDKTEFTKFVKE